jgi:hypothetical protein
MKICSMAEIKLYPEYMLECPWRNVPGFWSSEKNVLWILSLKKCSLDMVPRVKTSFTLSVWRFSNKMWLQTKWRYNFGQELSDLECEELAELFRYFNDHWMRQIPMWNVFDISERTNNLSEDKWSMNSSSIL